ncbi:hypothetical protein [Methylobacterium marchantiae]|uniref:Uncharacterized protein n=1 Tax=Methylobacterium marchantiae TaxID=600331 RepID=A0ABW3X0A6_9HYPH|nr:hypothetical protein AIGOOFII_1740 [Methylobacterium marchantiae]
MQSSTISPSIMSRPGPSRPTSRLQRHELQFRLLLVATYPFFLAAAALQRLVPARSPVGHGLVARRSVFGEAKGMAVSAIPFVFMG